MNWTQIYNRGLRLANTNAVDYNVSQASEDMELRHQDLVNRIVSVTREDYFWDVGTTDTVVYQSEYVVEKLGISPDDLDIKKINKVFVKYKSTDTYYTKLLYKSPTNLEHHPDYYKTNQSQNDAFFYIQDKSIFIYPAPEEAITWWLEVYCIHKPAEINTDSSEDEIEIPSEFHRLIAIGLSADIFYLQGKINEANDAEAKYEAGIRDMVAFMKSRYNNPKKKDFSKLNNYR